MLVVDMFVEDSSGRVKVVSKNVDFDRKKNWGIVWSFMYNENVLCGEIFDDVRLAVWEWDNRSKNLYRVDIE